MIYGYIYIILVREFGKNNEYIIKIGFTIQNCVFIRLNQYSYGSELIYYFYVSNPRELERLILCKLNNEFTNDELKYFKIHYGKEYFKIDVNKIYEIVYNVVKSNIINNFNPLFDIINKKFKKVSIYFNENVNKELYNIFIKQKLEFNYNNRTIFISNLINNVIENNILNIKDLYNFYLVDIKDNYIDNIKDNYIDNIKNNVNYTNIIINNDTNFLCNNCKKQFKSKQALLKHLNNPRLCENILKLKLLNIDRHANNINIQNNNENIKNNQNQNNSIKLYDSDVKLNDFLLNSYSYKHICDEDISSDDFYIYTNLLKILLKNRENHNIYFINDNAVVYSENFLNLVPKDKAIYFILYKLENVIHNIIENNNDKFKEKSNNIKKYYKSLLDQYKYDTIFSEYDIKENKFIYNINYLQLYSRDIYMKNINQIFNKHEEDTKNIFNEKNLMNDHTKMIKIIPNIEDFASKRLRYKDLKDKF